MEVETLLSFDGPGAYEAFMAELAQEIKSLSDVVLNHAGPNLLGEYPEVESSLQVSLMKLAQTGMITGEIGSDYWEAWIAEWGKGSLMDRDNPDLTAYMGSDCWNSLRGPDYDITGRAAPGYIGLDGLWHETSGKLAGISLEDLYQYDESFRAWADRTLGPGVFLPKPPLHFMRDALEANRNLIMDQINAVIEVFNFGDFFV